MTKNRTWIAQARIAMVTGAVMALAAGVAHASTNAEEALKTEPQKEAPQPAASKKKSTEVSFEDVLVQGKYHFSDEAVTTVEQDKVLDALLGVRTDFKDRLKKSTTRY